MGLCDRPDILQALHEEGIRFLRTWGRNENGAFTFTADGSKERIQPFWYETQGAPDILEFAMHGNDYNIRKELGWGNVSEYVVWARTQIDDIAEHNLVWSYAMHDHSVLRNDPHMLLVRQLLEYAIDKGVAIRSYRKEYERRDRKRRMELKQE